MAKAYTIRDILLDVSENYLVEYKNKFGNNPWKDILTKVPKKSFDFTNTKLKISGSAGQGRWAAIPWISLRDSEISHSTQQGFYLAYLFSYDMKEIYLSLNQGWTFYKNNFKPTSIAKKNIEQVSAFLRSKIDTNGRYDLLPSINLHAKNVKTDLPQGYEQGSIWAIKYESSSLPSNNVLKSDLGYMVFLEKSLKNFLIKKYSKSEISTYNFIDSLISDSVEHKIKLEEVTVPYNSSTKNPSQKYKKINFEQKNSKNSKIGLLGEKLVFQQEFDRLTNLGRKDLAEKVTIKSIISDSYHYDILSYDEYGNKIYIEVKTTTSKADTAFYISKNELEFGQQHKQNYEIWRLLNFNEEQLSAEYYILKGDPTTTLKAEPTTYSCVPNIL